MTRAAFAPIPNAPLLDRGFDERADDPRERGAITLFDEETSRARRDRVMRQRGFERVACDCDPSCVCPQLRTGPNARCTIWKRLSQPRSLRR